MAGVDDSTIWKFGDFGERFLEVSRGRVGEVGAADGVFEKGVAGKENLFAIIEADASRSMPWGFDDGEGFVANLDFVALFNKLIYRWNLQSFLFQPVNCTLIS